MKPTEFKTLQSIIDYLTETKGRIDRLKKRNPDLTFAVEVIKNLPLSVMFEMIDAANSNLDKWSSPSKLSESYDKKHLSFYASTYGKSIFPMSASIESVEIKKLTEPIPCRELYEEVTA